MDSGGLREKGEDRSRSGRKRSWKNHGLAPLELAIPGRARAARTAAVFPRLGFIDRQLAALHVQSVKPADGFLGSGTISYTNPGLVPQGVTVNSSINPTALPGFNFNTPAPLGTNPVVNPGVVGFQGIGNLGVGRASPTSGVGGFALGAITTGDDLTPVGVRVGDGDGLPGLPGDDHDGDGDGPLNGLPGQPDRDQVPPGLGDLTPPDLDGDDDDHGDDHGDDGDDDGSDDDADEDTGALT